MKSKGVIYVIEYETITDTYALTWELYRSLDNVDCDEIAMKLFNELCEQKSDCVPFRLIKKEILLESKTQNEITSK